MSFITTKFDEILLCCFNGVVRRAVLSSILILVKFLQKGELLPAKKLNQNFLWYAYLHIMSFITKKFQEILLSDFRGVVLTNCFE